MNLKLGYLEVIVLALRELLGEKIPVVTRFLIKKQISVIEPESQNYTENRIDLCKKYCSRDENDQPLVNNNQYVITDINRIEFDKELRELNEVDVNINIEPLTVGQLGNISTSGMIEILIDLKIVTE
jgi:hypothetical protein